MLSISYSLLEYRSYDAPNSLKEIVFIAAAIEDDIPITEQVVTPPPPPQPQAAPEIITIVEDIEEIQETVIESSETSQEEGIEEREINIEEVEVEEIEEDVSVPFSVVEQIPIYPGCNQTSNAELKACFQKKIQEHLLRNFRYPEEATETGKHGKVYVWFEINKEGVVSNIKTRGPHKILEKEASRIVSLLPKMIPGKQRGRPVKVPYSIPINFQLQD